MTDDSALFCNCEAPELALCPCATHAPEQYTAWLLEHAPRVHAAENTNDPLASKYTDPAGYETYPPVGEMEEFSALRSALSDCARDLFDKEWDLEREHGEWPGRLEALLHIRDEGASLAPLMERQAAREQALSGLGVGEYPFSDEEIFSGCGPVSVEELKAEAEALAQVAEAALRLKSMIETHICSGDPRRPTPVTSS